MSTERKINKIDPEKIQKDHLMAFVHYVKVGTVSHGHDEIYVEDLDNEIKSLHVRGKELLANAYSADLYTEEETVGKTRAAEILVNSPNRPLTVCFEKQDGTERTLRGRLVRPEPLLGRSMVEDLDLTGKDRLRQVDHRTIKFIIVDGVKYNVHQK